MRTSGALLLSMAGVLLTAQCAWSASVLRVGPFDFTAAARLEANYSTNVDQTRPSQSDLQQNDFFFIYGLDFDGVARLGPRLQIDLTWSLEWERYMKRTDLDTDADDPLGNARVTIPWEVTPALRLTTFAAYEHSLETRDSAFAGAGSSRTRRDENTITSYGAMANFARNRLRISSSYTSERERHVLDEFKDGDEDREQLTFITTYSLSPRLRLVYEFDRERSDLTQDPDDFTGNEDTYSVGFDVDLWLRPVLTYGFRYEREGVGEDIGTWQPVHILSARMEVLDHPTISLAGFASYRYEGDPEEDDVAFQYGLTLTQIIDPRTIHSFRLRREPVDTFGSTTDTTVTEWGYRLTRAHFLLPTVTAAFGIVYTINEPSIPAIPDEEVLALDVEVSHGRRITPQLSQDLAYRYSWEDSSLESELLEEHLFTLRFTYAF